jgi:hypothetical protein
MLQLITCVLNIWESLLQSFKTTKPLKGSVKPKGRSFSCEHLQLVKIKCSKDDVRVHKVAHLFRANGVPIKKIFVRRTGSTREFHFCFTHLFVYLFIYLQRQRYITSSVACPCAAGCP